MSINSETSSQNQDDKSEDNEPVNMQVLLDNDSKESLFGHL